MTAEREADVTAAREPEATAEREPEATAERDARAEARTERDAGAETGAEWDAAAAQDGTDPAALVTFDAVWTGDGFRGATTYLLRGERLHRVRAASAPLELGLDADAEPDRSDVSDWSDISDRSDLNDRGDLRDSNLPRLPSYHLPGTLFPHLTDHHVHLGLADPAALFTGGITHAHDLGWIPAVAAGWLRDLPDRPETTIAGALLTAAGGYPVRSGWAPLGAARELGGPRDGRRAVREQVMSGASRIKVALNSDAGETVDDATLSAIVDEAVASGLTVVAHAQGDGQTERAVRAGVHILAHTPFSERLDDWVTAEAVRRGMRWISTLDIHGWGAPSLERAIAIENLRRFHAAGGEVLYGTDLGNGPLPVGVNARELAALQEAGLDATEVLRSIAGRPDGGERDLDPPVGPRLAWVPGTPPGDAWGIPAWLATARGLRVSDLASALSADAATSAVRSRAHPGARSDPAAAAPPGTAADSGTAAESPGTAADPGIDSAAADPPGTAADPTPATPTEGPRP